ncbi:MAG: Polysaccharide biosynthesis protein CapD [Candidatus Giovannonibacteria bacterium GW2011_GWC2_44_9]|uniref:Polysaccharide biosynthesis protein CapD n=3 Tax=Candidatus Giovannoniibacteriota TaxID=1752738 RepID=A0A0G1IZ03_9BACT|nr:MAG: Polysaccharide biosynthesis protein CapD [Candidatus Giovannonibacteria bacterium GW2011_GWB1_44_23]KKT64280.1 MAG: Polysaccharide biosynthesis protein CapD [Candidatus Giovannonibacteria bacterium GW2011_GWA1_44_29]KKT83540.1 MAG: Polysaccharide biosynthesis protein CapD [Candidatus Giovannonibacteria bacterium GW2011_GWC2_44_9]KKT92007.1 MAG: Polysaccharide biosynthesis protein CapD [Parcubacteria group bacterium GW2011_GWC1_45_13]
MLNEFKNKNILVTGGTGSIGSEIVHQLLKFSPKVIRVFARHEDRHYQLMNELGTENERLRFVVGDIRDKDRLRMAMEGVDVVFHAAALKQVAMCEYNPFEAVKTNIIGTQNIIEAARDLKIPKVIGISTDKVAEPEGILGVSKLMAEKLFLSSFYYRGDKKTKFACVRFGNVLGSRGSLLPLLKKQIAANGEVAITDQKMTRFVMTVPQAVNLILSATNMMRGHEIFVLKMPAIRLVDLIKAAVNYYAPIFGKKSSDIKIKTIGRRAGEKIHEKLLADYEVPRALESGEMYILTPHETVARSQYKEHYLAAQVKVGSKALSSQYAPKLSKIQLEAMIKEADAHQI